MAGHTRPPIDMDEGHVSEDHLNEEPMIHEHVAGASPDSAGEIADARAEGTATYRRSDRSARITENAKRDRRRRAALVAAAVAGVLVLLLAADAVAMAGKVHHGVSVAGIELGGRPASAAEAVLRTELPKVASEPVTVVHGDQTWLVSAAEVGLSFDYETMAADAMAVGRDGGFFSALAERVTTWVAPARLGAIPVADASRLASVLDTVAAGVNVPAKNASIAIEGTTVSLVPASDGVAIVRDAHRWLLPAFLAKDRRVEAPTEIAKPEVEDEGAEAALETAKLMLAAPVTVTYEKKSWTFGPADIATWLSFRPAGSVAETSASSSASSSVPTSGRAGTLEAYIDPAKAEKSIGPKLGAVGRPAKDAKFQTAGGAVSIIPSVDGLGPDIAALSTELTALLPSAESTRAVELRMKRVAAALTTEKARSMGITQRISTFTTTYAASNKSRVNNIHLLGDSLDGKLIGPGETFSFNGAVGERTAAKGYKEANAIVQGKLVPQLGGGICQVATTLFNTVYESGLPVVQRSNHSFYIDHYPKGRDATVSWGGPDLKFKNDTQTWMLIAVGYTNSSVTISLYGTDPGYEVTSKAGPWTNVRAYPIEEEADPSLPAGTKVVFDSGITGRRIVVTRTVRKGGAVVRTDEFVSNYKPKVQVVHVGTKPATSTTPTRTP